MTSNIKSTKKECVKTEYDVNIHFDDEIEYEIFCEAIDKAYTAYQLVNAREIDYMISKGILHDPLDDTLFMFKLLLKLKTSFNENE